jgi:arylsulfatase A-like enzyme
MNRREFLSFLGAATAAVGAGNLFAADAVPVKRKPNIIVFVVDDLGYADLGCQGSAELATPNIDSIAANGVRFTSGYVSCPVCSPTRAGMLTGRYQERFGHEFNPGPGRAASTKEGLPLTERTVAEDLKAAGYVTGMIGKWHLGMAPKFHPQKRGFDEFYGFLGGMHSYIDAKAMPNNLILRNSQPVDEKEYLTDAFNREAVEFVDRHHEQPFFLYLPYNAVHLPLQAPQEYLKRCAHIRNTRRRIMAAMLLAMDDGVGMVLDRLRRYGIEEDTLIFFFSDNGGPTPVNHSSNAPLSGLKTDLYEGAIRIPFMCQWKGRIPAGVVSDEPIISLDIMPTSLAAAGVALPKERAIDGVNLLPLLTGQTKQPPHEMLFWRYGELQAVRRGNMKLLRVEGESDKLFDLAADIGEKHDLAAEKPGVVRELGAALSRWNGELAQPLWSQPIRKGVSHPHAEHE